MRFHTSGQLDAQELKRLKQWHKKFLWLPCDVETADGTRRVWLERVYQRLTPGRHSVVRGKFLPNQYCGGGQWERRVVEYHVQKLLTTKEPTK